MYICIYIYILSVTLSFLSICNVPLEYTCTFVVSSKPCKNIMLSNIYHLFVPFNNIPYPYCQLASSPSMNRIVEWHLDGKLAN